MESLDPMRDHSVRPPSQISGEDAPTLEWSLNSKNEMPNLNQTFSTVGGYEKSCEKVWGGSDPPTRSERPPKVYVVSHTNRTCDFEVIFEISYFQSTQKLKCPICYPYGPNKLQAKV